eukprot:623129-Pelagomonas_calceolata.AAC.1
MEEDTLPTSSKKSHSRGLQIPSTIETKNRKDEWGSGRSLEAHPNSHAFRLMASLSKPVYLCVGFPCCRLNSVHSASISRRLRDCPVCKDEYLKQQQQQQQQQIEGVAEGGGGQQQ